MRKAPKPPGRTRRVDERKPPARMRGGNERKPPAITRRGDERNPPGRTKRGDERKPRGTVNGQGPAMMVIVEGSKEALKMASEKARRPPTPSMLNCAICFDILITHQCGPLQDTIVVCTTLKEKTIFPTSCFCT